MTEDGCSSCSQLAELLRVAISPPHQSVRAVALAAFTSGMLALLGLQYVLPALMKAFK